MKGPPWEPCGYGCGKPWRRWAGSKLIGHAKCAIDDDEKLRVLARLEVPGVRQADVAAAYGVTVAIVRAWQADALKLRRGAA